MTAADAAWRLRRTLDGCKFASLSRKKKDTADICCFYLSGYLFLFKENNEIKLYVKRATRIIC